MFLYFNFPYNIFYFVIKESVIIIGRMDIHQRKRRLNPSLDDFSDECAFNFYFNKRRFV